jgi:hypothetical protein
MTISELQAEGYIFINPNHPPTFLSLYLQARNDNPIEFTTRFVFNTTETGYDSTSYLESGMQIGEGTIWAISQEEWAWIVNNVSGEMPVPFTPSEDEADSGDGTPADDEDDNDSESGGSIFGFLNNIFGFKLFNIPFWIVLLVALLSFKMMKKK